MKLITFLTKIIIGLIVFNFLFSCIIISLNLLGFDVNGLPIAVIILGKINYSTHKK